MRIVIDLQPLQTQASARRGVGRYTENIVRNMLLENAGHEVYLALNGSLSERILEIREVFADLIDPAHVKIWRQSFQTQRLSGPVSKGAIAAGEILREVFLNALEPDFILSTNLQEGLGEDVSTSVHRLRYPTQYCTTLHDVVPYFYPEYLSDQRVRDWYKSKISYAKISDLLLTVSESARQDIIEKLDFSPDRIFVIENAYDSSIFNSKRANIKDVRRLRNTMGLAEQFFLYYGGNDDHKNLYRLLSAYSLLPERLREKAPLVLAGRDLAGDAKIRQKMENLRLGERVQTPGFVDDTDLPTLIKMSTALVYPSTHEGFGLPALEAMACGTAVIGSASSSVGEVIGTAEALFDPYDPANIAEKMAQVLTDADFRSGLQAGGVARAARYSWRRSAQRLWSVLEAHERKPAGRRYYFGDPIEHFVRHAGLHLKAEPDALLAKIATSAADSFTEPRRPRLFLDISSIIRRDDGTGIQRVTRAVASEVLKLVPKNIEAELVYTGLDDLEFYAANAYVRKMFSAKVGPNDDQISFVAGDILIYLDLHPGVAIAHRAYNDDLRAKGVAVYFVVYDLLPVLRPKTFWPELVQEFREWLDVVSRSDGAICISRAVADELAAYSSTFGSPRVGTFNIGWFHLGADIASSAPSGGVPRDAVKLLERLEKRPSFLMVGTLEPRKGHRHVLDAFELLWRRGVDATLVLVGRQGWNMKDFCEGLMAHPELGARLFWLKGVSDEYLDKIYAASWCLIAASEGEGFGLPLIEAARHGVPIIARDIPVFREVAGDAAFFFDDERPAQDLAEALESWLLLYSGGRHPKSEALEYLTWSQSASRLVDVVSTGDWLHQVNAAGALGPYGRQRHYSDRLKFRGFSISEPDRRWSSGSRAEIGFIWSGSPGFTQLRLKCSTHGAQNVTIKVAGVELLNGVIELDQAWLYLNTSDLMVGPNIMEFTLPDARAASDKDHRLVALAFHEFEIAAGLDPIKVGVAQPFNSNSIEWHEFSAPEDDFRWTASTQPWIAFTCVGSLTGLELMIVAQPFGEQIIRIAVNGKEVFKGTPAPGYGEIKALLPQLHSGYNIISFDLPMARRPGGGDDRLLALAIKSVLIRKAAKPKRVVSNRATMSL